MTGQLSKIGAYVIHLERAVERRDQIERIRNAVPLPIKIVPAVDGLQVQEKQFRARYHPKLLTPHYPFNLRAGEIGCFLSHRKCWEMILASSNDGALIFEDDVEIDAVQFKVMLAFMMTHCSVNDYVRFPNKNRAEGGAIVAELGTMRLVWPRTPGAGTVGQYVGREAARQLLLSTERFDRPVDGFLQLVKSHKVRILTAEPHVMRDVSATIGASHIQASKVPFHIRLHHEIARPLYRCRLNRINRL